MALSESTHGAGSPIMAEAVRRITTAFCDDSSTRDTELHASAVRRSFVLSVDMAHAVHPNYANKHEKNHGPKMNAGVVIKTNQNQRCKHSQSLFMVLIDQSDSSCVDPYHFMLHQMRRMV